MAPRTRAPRPDYVIDLAGRRGRRTGLRLLLAGAAFLGIGLLIAVVVCVLLTSCK